MSMHTEAPWTVVPREVMEDGTAYPRSIVGGIKDHLICYLEANCVADIAVQQPGTHWDTTPAKEANARLISAAPDLLDAGSRLLSLLDREEVEECLARFGFVNMREAMRAAIAKATGDV